MTDQVVEKNVKEKPFSKTINAYASICSPHGIFYIFESNRLPFERILWVLVVGVFIGFAINWSISAYQSWKEYPILTTVATTGLAIENVSFPSITICTQGSANDIVDAAIFKQFVEYLEEKNIVYDQLSDDEVQQETYKFLNDRYPGSRQLPNQLVRMLGSPDVEPDNKIESRTIMNPEDVTACSPPLTSNQSITNDTNQRKKRQFISVDCPGGFTQTGSGSCWHSSKQSMTYDDAVTYCSNQGNGLGEMLYFQDDDEITELYEMLKLEYHSEGK